AAPTQLVNSVGPMKPIRLPRSWALARSAGVKVTNGPVHSKKWYFLVGAVIGGAAGAAIGATNCDEPGRRGSCIGKLMLYGWGFGGGIGAEVGEAAGAP